MLLLLVALGLAGDIDGDAIDDAVDNCVFYANADQADGNGDGYGDACAHPTAALGANVTIAPNVTIGARAVIGDNVVLLPRAVVGTDAFIGDGAIVGGVLADAGAAGPVRVLEDAVIGRRARLAMGVQVAERAGCRGAMDEASTLGSDGMVNGQLGPLTHVGERSVVRGRIRSQSTVGNDVRSAGQIGHRVTLHDGARIGHAARVGDDSVIGADVIVAPGVRLGERTQLGAEVRVRRGSELGDDVSVGEDAVLRRDTDVPAGLGIVGGTVTGPGPVASSGTEVCTDGQDNDADSRIDCLDDDCASHFACSVETNCGDGTDNDYDGAVDCDDRDCTGQAACPGEADCADGLDNNNNGVADCSDPTCFGAPGCTVERLCEDGLDNDADGYVDRQDGDLSFVGDPDCGAIVEDCPRSHTSWPADNDGDGLGSWHDPDCWPGRSELCDNGVDDDANGLVDCEDSACSTSDMCVEDCLDGVDNDGNGFADCADDACLGEICLAERRVSGGEVYLSNQVRRSTVHHGVQGGGCVGPETRMDYQMDVASMSVVFDEVDVQLRIPTSMGGFSSSTCVMEPWAGGLHVGAGRQYGQVVQATPLAGSRRVLPEASGPQMSRPSGACNWPDQAMRAAVFEVEPGARLARDVDGQPLVMQGLGVWDVGTPSFWFGESREGAEFRPHRHLDSCSDLVAFDSDSQEATWTLPVQTHTFLPPTP